MKFSIRDILNWLDWVSTLAVEWIEILRADKDVTLRVVSTLAVEWIEIAFYPC